MFSIVRLTDDDFYNKKVHEGDSGIDVFFTEDQIIYSQTFSTIIKLGIKCALTVGNESSSYLLMPRSSISKTPLRMSNSFGLIDAGYRGELMVKVDNLSEDDFEVKKGTSLFQLVGPTFKQCKFQLVDSLDNTTRGEGGFGSTGI